MGDLMSCTEADPLIAANAVHSLDEDALPRLRRHLAGCAACRQLAASYARTALQLPLALEPVRPSPALKRRLMAAVYADAAGTRPPEAAPVSWFRRLWQAIPAAPGWTIAGGLAGAAALVVASWLGMRTPHTPRPTSTAMSISGTTARPLAHGSLIYDGQRQNAVLTVDGLGPQPDPGSAPAPTYEVWLIGSGGAAEPAAYLAPEPKGTAWTGAFQGDITRFKALVVTLEPNQGRLTPSGPELLRADLSITP